MENALASIAELAGHFERNRGEYRHVCYDSPPKSGTVPISTRRDVARATSAQVRRRSRSRRRQFYLFLTLFAFLAGWSTTQARVLWQEGGVRAAPLFCGGAAFSACEDERGGTFITWSDSFQGSKDVFVQHLDILGHRLWGENGIRIPIDTGRQDGPRVVPDGYGGVIVAWDDERVVSRPRVFVQRFDQNGNALWDPLGVPVCTLRGHFLYLTRSRNDTFLVCYGPNFAQGEIWLQKLDLNGNRIWGAQGRCLVGDPAPNGWPNFSAMASDGSGGVYLGFTDMYCMGTPPHCQYGAEAQFRHLLADGSQSVGRLFWYCSGLWVPPSWRNVSVASDRAGSAFVAWRDSPFSSRFRIARLVSDAWTWPGTWVASSWEAEALIPDNYGTVFAPGRVGRTHYIQCCDSTGRRWGDNGVLLDTSISGSAAAADDSAGVVVVYATSQPPALKAKWFRHDGTLAWSGVFDSLSSSPSGPSIVNDRNGGCVAVWQGSRNSQWGLYAQRFDFHGAARDVGVREIRAVPDTVDLGDVVRPQAVVHNYGSQSASFPVSLRISSVYADTVTLLMDTGATDTVSFRDWTATTNGTLTVRCTTALPDDSNPANNATGAVVTVGVFDIAALQILAPPGNLHLRDSVRPSASVRNLGTGVASFDVCFRIGNAYCDTMRVSGLLPDSLKVVTFPRWNATFGEFVVSCSTMLARDMFHENDKIERALSVRNQFDLDASVERIMAPAFVVDSGPPIIPRALVANLGNRAAVIPVQFRMGAGYADTQTVQLEGGAEDTVTFRACAALPRGATTVVCTTALANDSFPANSVLTETVSFRVRDARVVQILSPPDSILSDTWVMPQARVCNSGTAQATFDVACRIATSYSEVVSVIGLMPDSSRIVSFPFWGAVSGRWLVACSTRLSSDANPGNDRVDESLQVVMRRVVIRPDTSGSICAACTVDYRLRVFNCGNRVDTFDLWSSGTRMGWNLVLLDSAGRALLTDHNGNGLADIGAVPPGGTCWITARISASADQPVGAVDSSRVTARSSRDTTFTWAARLLTTVVPAVTQLVVAPNQRGEQVAGETQDYALYVQTVGNLAAVVALRCDPPSSVWQVDLWDSSGTAPLLDANHDGFCEFGPVPPGVQSRFTLRIKAPDSIPDNLLSGSSLRFPVIARTVRFYPLTDTALITIQAIPGFCIHNYANPFHGWTQFMFSIPRPSRVRLVVYDQTGSVVSRLVNGQTYPIGIYTLPWRATSRGGRTPSAGVYPYILELVDDKGRVTERTMRKLVIW
jgi:hypothetical protein